MVSPVGTVRRRLAVPVVLALVGMLPAPVAHAQSAADLAAALQRRYDGVRDFSTTFTHTYEGGILKKQLTEHGRLQVKKPGKMRWEYQTPEHKLFVSDGVKIYSYIPLDRQVIVSGVPLDDRASGPALFLAGKGSIVRDFTPSLAELPPGHPSGARALKLVPTTPQTDYDWLVLSVDPGTLALRGLLSVDAQGGRSSFVFTDLKENMGIADKHFEFSIPRGVDVVTDSGLR